MTDEQQIKQDALNAVNQVKAWYAEKPFYVGLVVGAIVALVIRHFV